MFGTSRLAEFQTATLYEEDVKAADGKKGSAEFRLRSVCADRGLTYKTHTSGAKKREEERDIPSANRLQIAPGNLLSPPAWALTSPEQLHAYEKQHGTFGGYYSDLLSGFLSVMDSKKYGDIDKARHFGPPSLIWQGGRTQSDWLFRFLLNPHKVRELTVLRMPRFNMSDEEAKTLVNYFAAIDKLNNVRENLEYPYFKIPQRGSLEDEYWRQKTSEYLARLEKTPDPRDPKNRKKSLLTKELDELEPQWKEILGNLEAQAKKVADRFEEAKKPYDPAQKRANEAAEAFTKAKKAEEAEKGCRPRKRS